MPQDKLSRDIDRAAVAIREADALLVCAGAGMGVDSGLPDFRGAEGFWRAYPPFAKLNLQFEDVADPLWFENDPALAWGFYGHRFNLYRDTEPHEGFHLLRQWAENKPHGYFVFTSNVDGHFTKAGFAADQIVECHGSLHFLQCAYRCDRSIWEAPNNQISINEETMRAIPPFPACPRCGQVARPNVLMFGDGDWIAKRTTEQEQRLDAWLRRVHRLRARVTIIECGAGRIIPSVRWFSDQQAVGHGATLIRINPRDPNIPMGAIGSISLPLGAKDALTLIAARLEQMA